MALGLAEATETAEADGVDGALAVGSSVGAGDWLPQAATVRAVNAITNWRRVDDTRRV